MVCYFIVSLCGRTREVKPKCVLSIRNTDDDGRVTVIFSADGLCGPVGTAISQNFRRLTKVFCLCGIYCDNVGKFSQTETPMDTMEENDNTPGVSSDQQLDDRRDLTWASHPVMTL